MILTDFGVVADVFLQKKETELGKDTDILIWIGRLIWIRVD